MTQVCVVIPNWNGRHLLARCLDALAAQTFQDFRVLIVDNGSSDGSVPWIEKNHSAIEVIAKESNIGFAAAINEGIRLSDSRYVVTLNNDTEPDPIWLAALVAAAEGDVRVGMCASKMLFAHRPEMINSAGICLDQAAIAWDRHGGELDDERETQPLEVFGPCAGAALYRRAMLEEIGLFDEDFFAYLEDVDLAWRGRRQGWHCLYVPAARVLHHHSATGIEGSPFKSYHLGRNKVWLIVKNYPFRQLWSGAIAALVYDCAAVLFALVAQRDIHALRGRLAGLARLRTMWRKRHPGKSSCRPDIEWLVPLDALWRIPGRYRHLARGKMAPNRHEHSLAPDGG